MQYLFFFFLMIRRPPRSTLDRSSAASDVYKRQVEAALVAGNDLALYFGDVDEMNQVLDQLEEAVNAGRLSEAQVDRSLARIVALKSSGACNT